jgi:hypothetical protein
MSKATYLKSSSMMKLLTCIVHNFLFYFNFFAQQNQHAVVTNFTLMINKKGKN